MVDSYPRRPLTTTDQLQLRTWIPCKCPSGQSPDRVSEPSEELLSSKGSVLSGELLINYIRRLRAWSLRQFVFAIIVIGILGLTAELLLIEHTESFTQWIPLGVLLAGFASSAWLAYRPGRYALRVFQVVMAGFVAAGVAGLYFHYAGNVEFAIERDSALSGAKLAWKAFRGATPFLAPGALAQLGLLGLAYTYAHPITQPNATGES